MELSTDPSSATFSVPVSFFFPFLSVFERVGVDPSLDFGVGVDAFQPVRQLSAVWPGRPHWIQSPLAILLFLVLVRTLSVLLLAVLYFLLTVVALLVLLWEHLLGLRELLVVRGWCSASSSEPILRAA